MNETLCGSICCPIFKPVTTSICYLQNLKPPPTDRCVFWPLRCLVLACLCPESRLFLHERSPLEPQISYITKSRDNTTQSSASTLNRLLYGNKSLNFMSGIPVRFQRETARRHSGSSVGWCLEMLWNQLTYVSLSTYLLKPWEQIWHRAARGQQKNVGQCGVFTETWEAQICTVTHNTIKMSLESKIIFRIWMLTLLWPEQAEGELLELYGYKTTSMKVFLQLNLFILTICCRIRLWHST